MDELPVAGLISQLPVQFDQAPLSLVHLVNRFKTLQIGSDWKVELTSKAPLCIPFDPETAKVSEGEMHRCVLQL